MWHRNPEVFSLWEDFQPITFYHSGRREMRINGSFAINAVNYSDSEIEFDLKIKENLKISKTNHGNIIEKSDTEIKTILGAGDILIFETKE